MRRYETEDGDVWCCSECYHLAAFDTPKPTDRSE